MGSVTKQKSVYGTLLRVYPRQFREYYGLTMTQTMDDLLAGESSWSGRAAVWARALTDLPISAAKEHLSDGKELSMNRKMKFVFTGVVTVLLLANLASFWYGNLHARSTIGAERVTPVRLADAMQHDSFYSSYGNAALLFSGKVVSISQKDGTQLATFYTGHTYSVTCQFSGPEKVKVNQHVSVTTTGGSADRLTHGVLLHNCLQG